MGEACGSHEGAPLGLASKPSNRQPSTANASRVRVEEGQGIWHSYPADRALHGVNRWKSIRRT